MRKMKRVVFLLAAIAACVLCLCAFGSKVKVFSDNFDRPERFARYWNHNAGEVPGTVEYLPGGGADGGGCVKIASAEKTALAIKHKLTGLHPGKLYRLSALMKCDSVQDGRGAVLYLDPEGLEQSWNASESPTAPTTGRKCIWISCPTGRAKPSSAAAWDSPGAPTTEAKPRGRCGTTT